MTGRRRAQEPPERGSAAVDPEPDPESVARAIALRMLTAAPRSRKQLADAMIRRDVPPEVVTRVLDRFTEVGLVDDPEYARALVRSKRASRGLARRALAAELRGAGIGEEDAADALGQVDEDAERETARALVRRKWRPDLDAVTQTRRLLAMLARKGYSYGLSRRVLDEMRDDGTDADRGLPDIEG